MTPERTTEIKALADSCLARASSAMLDSSHQPTDEEFAIISTDVRALADAIGELLVENGKTREALSEDRRLGQRDSRSFR